MAITWARTGAAAHAEAAKHEKEQKQKLEQTRKMWRFGLKEGMEGRITFVDGFLDPDGMVDYFQYYEHHLMLNGSWGHFYTCIKEMEPCPICEANDSSALVGALTVIDHSEYTSKKGVTYKDMVRLFIAKPTTLKQLQILGGKRGGLAGCTFDVVRSGDKSPGVGSMFDFIEKQEIEVLKKKYSRVDPETKKSISFFVPADYAKECAPLTVEEIHQQIPTLASAAPVGHVTAEQKKALEDNL